jgi:predicted ATP-binding protein involved in virulence
MVEFLSNYFLAIAGVGLGISAATALYFVYWERSQRRKYEQIMAAERKELEQKLNYQIAKRAEAELANSAATGASVDLGEVLRVQESRDAFEFQRNAIQGALVSSMSFKDTGLFSDGVWPLRPGLNVLLGRNGYGKSLLLRELAAMLVRSESQLLARNSPAQLSAQLTIGAEEQVIIRRQSGFERSPGPVPVLAISDTRFVNRNEDALRPVRDPYAGLSRHGAYHFLHQLPSNTIVQGLLYSLCVDYFEAGQSFSSPIFRMINAVFKELTDDSFRFHSVTRPDPNSFNLSVKTEGNPDPVPIQAASQGTLSVLAVFGLIYRFLEQLRALQPSVETPPCKSRAIVIIDEIDAHLHPSWQQRIAGLLHKTFPEVQFVLSAHSPLLVAGCNRGEVSVMKKDGGRFQLVNLIERDFIGAKADDIYKAVFDVDAGEDDVFVTYSKLAAQQKDNRPRISALSAQEHLDVEEQQELQQLVRENRLMRRASAVEEQRAEEVQKLVTLETEASLLRIQVRELQEQLGRQHAADAPAAESAKKFQQESAR